MDWGEKGRDQRSGGAKDQNIKMKEWGYPRDNTGICVAPWVACQKWRRPY